MNHLKIFLYFSKIHTNIYLLLHLFYRRCFSKLDFSPWFIHSDICILSDDVNQTFSVKIKILIIFSIPACLNNLNYPRVSFKLKLKL